jgi:hypothetical protein
MVVGIIPLQRGTNDDISGLGSSSHINVPSIFFALMNDWILPG